ncbi:MAG: hypothetical protein JHC95_01925 [Solirubrobacteraceae bacterium]|nr:hypothetical protein [Solirubrobacteraceae bacterium]
MLRRFLLALVAATALLPTASAGAQSNEPPRLVGDWVLSYAIAGRALIKLRLEEQADGSVIARLREPLTHTIDGPNTGIDRCSNEGDVVTSPRGEVMFVIPADRSAVDVAHAVQQRPAMTYDPVAKHLDESPQPCSTGSLRYAMKISRDRDEVLGPRSTRLGGVRRYATSLITGDPPIIGLNLVTTTGAEEGRPAGPCAARPAVISCQGYAPQFILAPDLKDTDGDGLLDGWERNGVRIAGDFIDLPAMGAKVDHKDLFIEADHRPGTRFSQEMNETMIRTFAAIEIPNPDSRNGITLHVDGGPNSIMNPRTGATWGDRSQSTESAEIPSAIGSFAPGCGAYDWRDGARVQASLMRPSRRPFFRYAIVTDRVGAPGAGCAGGLSAGTPGSVFIISSRSANGTPKTDAMRTITFMHETGHTLGLRHGGADDLNYKPNHVSIMSYNYSLTGVPQSRGGVWLGFSITPGGASTAIDERAVIETAGLPDASAGLDLARGTFRCGAGDHVVPWRMPTDLNCDRAISGAPQAISVNGDAEFDVLNTGPEAPLITFVGGAISGLNREPIPPTGNTEFGTTERELLDAAAATLGDRRAPTLRLRRRGGRVVATATDDTGVGRLEIRVGTRVRVAKMRVGKRGVLPAPRRRVTLSVRAPRAKTVTAIAVDGAGRSVRRSTPRR